MEMSTEIAGGPAWAGQVVPGPGTPARCPPLRPPGLPGNHGFARPAWYGGWLANPAKIGRGEPRAGGTVGGPPLRRRGYELTAWNESGTAGDHTTGRAAPRTGRAVAAAGSVTVNVDPRPGAL